MKKDFEKQRRSEPVKIQVTDRRPRFEESGEAVEEHPPPEKRLPTMLADLKSRAEAAEAKLAEALNLLRRREAEAEASRARLRREMERRTRAQVESFLQNFLQILDSLDWGVASSASDERLASLREGLGKVRDQFLSNLARQGIEPMVLEGTPYDPGLAEAVAVSPVPKGGEDGQVLEEIRRGYTYEGKVLRAAQVRVARNPAPAPTSPTPVITEKSPPTNS